MRKSIFLASLLFGSSAFANLCGEPTGFVWTFESPVYTNPGQFCDANPPYPRTTCQGTTRMIKEYMSNGDGGNPQDPTYNYAVHQQIYNSTGITCPANTTKDAEGVCRNALNPDNYPDAPDPFAQYNNDQAGCDSAGGYYFADGSCNGGSQAIKKIFQDGGAVTGAMLTIGGLIWTSAGIASMPYTAGGSGLAIGVGANATLAGLGMMGIIGASKLASPISTSSNDVTNGTNRIKVSLTSAGGSGGSLSGTHVTQTNTITGKVDSVTFIPDTVKTATQNSANVNKTNGTLNAPISLAGVRTTSYNNSTKVATTVTHSATSTSTTPVTTSKTVSFVVAQNPDGTVSSTPTNLTDAPAVSGSGGGYVTNSGGGSGTTSGTGTGTTSGDGKDYTGVLNDIKKNTGDSAGFLSDIKGFFNNDTEVNTALSDGSDGFDGYQGDIEGSFAGFIYTDPLGLNNIAGGSSIPEYGFTMMGTHFTIMDQALLNQLPLDLLRGLFLFMAALAGFITVFSGV